MGDPRNLTMMLAEGLVCQKWWQGMSLPTTEKNDLHNNNMNFNLPW